MSDRLHDFAKAVVVRQQEQHEDVDEATLQAVARDLGMSDEELLQARAEGQARKQRAQTLRQQQLIDEAIAELEQAHAFNPLDVEATVMLAEVLVKRGRKHDDGADLERARALCQAALKAAPANTEAASLLNVIQNNPAGERSAVPAGIIIGAAIAVGFIGVIVITLLRLLG
jgi:tetratricopeptide (TPR) repeat protein